jgi:hypothetical protein
VDAEGLISGTGPPSVNLIGATFNESRARLFDIPILLWVTFNPQLSRCQQTATLDLDGMSNLLALKTLALNRRGVRAILSYTQEKVCHCCVVH